MREQASTGCETAVSQMNNYFWASENGNMHENNCNPFTFCKTPAIKGNSLHFNQSLIVWFKIHRGGVQRQNYKDWIIV